MGQLVFDEEMARAMERMYEIRNAKRQGLSTAGIASEKAAAPFRRFRRSGQHRAGPIESASQGA